MELTHELSKLDKSNSHPTTSPFSFSLPLSLLSLVFFGVVLLVYDRPPSVSCTCILWGLIPFKSSMVHPIELLYFFSIFTNFFSSFSCSPKLIIAGQFFSEFKKTYFKLSGICSNYVLVLDSFFLLASKGTLKSSHMCALYLIH